jgi:flagellar hook-associated protein 3 FlgL
MLAGLDGYTPTFLLNLNNTENAITQTNQQISSGIRVNVASDDPGDIASILDYQNQVNQITQVQTNLNAANTSASAADNALSSATSLLNQLSSIAAEGASSTATAATRTSLGQQVQGIEQQLVDLANTTVQGQYIFGGDDPSTQPYTYNWSATEGATQVNTAANTRTIQDINGQTTVPSMTAQQIFDARNTDGTAATGNVFAAAYALGTALLSNNQSGVQSATALVSAASTQLGQATTFYGNVEDWIQNASSDASSTLTGVQTEVGSLRDTNVAAAATDLTTEQTAMQAALSAEGNLSVKSLFDYMG